MAEDKLMGDRYGLKYSLICDNNEGRGFSTDEIETAKAKEDIGAADALLIASVMRKTDGELSILFLSLDGQQKSLFGAMPSLDIFHVWSALANQLSQNDKLPIALKKICKDALMEARYFVIRNRQGGPNSPGDLVPVEER